MRLIPAIVLLASTTLFIGSAEAKKKREKKFDCGWEGEELDPFTGIDSRTTGRSWGNGVTIRFGRPNEGVSTGKVALTIREATDEPFSGPIQFLLMDKTVVTADLEPPVPGAVGVNSSGYAYTYFEMPLVLTAADLEMISTGLGVTRVRFNLPVGSPWDMVFNEGDEGQLPSYAQCALAPTPVE